MIQTTQSFEARGAPEVRSVEVVLRDTLQKLLANATRRNKELRDEAEADLSRLDNGSGSGINAEEFALSLKLALEAAGAPKVVTIALDAIQKLVTYGFLTGKGPDPFQPAETGQQRRFLIDALVNSVCTCAEQGDETVQLHIIYTLQAMVTANTCEVHGMTLVMAITSCLNVYRDSKNTVNQKTAQSALTQMLTVITQRMELSSAEMSRRTVDLSSQTRGAAKTPQQSASAETAARLSAHAELALLPKEQLLDEWMSSYLGVIMDQVVIKKDPNPTGPNGSEAGPGKFGWCVFCRNPAAHYCVETRDPVCGHTCKYRNLARLSLVETYYSADKDEAQSESLSETLAGPSAPSQPSSGSIQTTSLAETPSQDTIMADTNSLNPAHQDAIIVFDTLCNLSMKEPPGWQQDQRLCRSKRIALELILSMLQNFGPVFRSSPHFIAIMKEKLCVSLIKNSVSPIPKIFGASLQIFVTLITNFKQNMRTEIGVFIEQIFLRILESGNSTFQQKAKVLAVFDKLCTDATTALEIFLNFDCDVDEKNVFERTVDCLSKIAQGKYTALEHANIIQPQQEQELKAQALQALVTLMGSIVDWARRMSEDKMTPALGGVNGGHLEESCEAGTAESDGEDDVKSELSMGAIKSDVASSIVTSKQRKLELQLGVNKFNMKPKRGVDYLKQIGVLGDDPVDLANLFKNKDIGLDKTAIGDYLGEDKAFNKSTLYALVDSLDFKGKDLDSALRTFLSFFRLPGEAQKIDRMMEKFAEKFCNDNPDLFVNADCAFVLSFSLIMLQTDLHNPGVRNKMTKEDFVRNNRGINNNQDLPREYLEALYDSVANNPISLQEDVEARARNESQSANTSQKLALFERESENIVARSQELMREKGGRKNSVYVTAESVEHVRPLFEVACWPYLATLAVLLEMQDSPSSVELCIEGFKHCIRIAARFDMDTERDAFVSSLAKFTYLTTIKEMKQKNIECIKALLAIGQSEGNNLGPSWQYVLYCISQLERLQLIGTRSRHDANYFEDEAAQSPATLSGRQSLGGANNQVIKRRAHGLGVSALVSLGVDDRQVELVNSESVASQIDSAQIDLLFNKSTNLSPQAVVHFVTQLAKVSKAELEDVGQPRIFALQKLVEVADFNMNRIRVVWARIWKELSKHFVEVAAHQNIRVGKYAVDSLRQLAYRFLAKEELGNYNFQADFLKPFEVIVVSTPGVSREVKDYIVNVMDWMTNVRLANIKSGWKTVFHICGATALENTAESIVQCAFGIVEKVTEQNYSLFVENFTDGIRTLITFGQCKVNLQMSLQAITHLLQAADYLADPKTPDPPPPPSSSLVGPNVPVAPSTTSDGGSHPAAHWFPILRGLALLVSDPRRDVRAMALNGVFDVLRDHGSNVFDKDTWRMVFNGVIKPLFDDIHHQLVPQGVEQHKQDHDRSEGTAASWAVSMGPPTCLAALTALVRLFETHLETLAFLLDDVLRLIQNCIQHELEAVARIGVEGFKQLILSTGKKLKPDSWLKVTRSVLFLFKESMPTKLMHVEVKAASSLPFSKDDVVIQCVVQLLLIDMLQDAACQHYEQIPQAGIMTLLDALKQSFEFAQEFNRQIELRQALKRLGFMREMKQLPGLLKQERESLSCSLKILFQVQADPRMQGTDFVAQAVDRLLQLCSSVLRNYVSKERLLHERSEMPPPNDLPPESVRDREAATVEIEREVLGLVPIISEVVMKGLRDLPQEQFHKHASELFPLISELTIVNSREVRSMVREVLLHRVAPLLSVATVGIEATTQAHLPEAASPTVDP